MVAQLNLLKEKWKAVVICLADYQHKLAWQYNQGIKVRDFATGDLVLRRAMGITRDGMPGSWHQIGKDHTESSP